MNGPDPRDRDPLLALAIAIADGTPVEWPEGTSATESGALRDRLRELEQLGRGYEVRRSRPDETVLTEARRTRGTEAGEPVHVEWGPLVVLDKIGRGSFGDVYRAWDPRLEREVALKLVPEHDGAAS